MQSAIDEAGAAASPEPLKISRTLRASRQTVFRAWGDGVQVGRWFAPHPYTVPDARVDMRVGGAFDVCMRSPAGETTWTRGVFVEVTADSRLVIDMQITDGGGKPLFAARTQIDLSDAPGGTRIDVTQSYTMIDPAAAAMVTGAPRGWGATLDQLEAQLARSPSVGDSAVRSVVHATFHLHRTYQAPLARVWAALTDQGAKQKWFRGPPEGWTLLERRMDVRPGGRERLRGRWDSGLVSDFDAIYYDVIPQERLVYSYEMRLDDKKISVSLASVQLRADGGATTVMITEQGAFLDGYDDAGSREQGTGHLLDALGASLRD